MVIQNRNSNPPSFNLTKVPQLIGTLKQISEIGFYKKEVEDLLSIAVFKQTKEQVIINQKDYSLIFPRIAYIKEGLIHLTALLDEVIETQKPETISIKLPKVNNLSDLEKVIKDLNQIFSQTILHKKIKGSIEIKNFDSGSLWLEIFVGCSAALQLIAGLVWSGSVIYKKMQEGHIFNEYAKSIKIKNESIKDIQEKQKEMLDLVVKAETENIYNNFYKEKEIDNEQMARLNNSLKLMADLIHRGTEIHTALSSPENVSNLFPDYKNMVLIESKVKKLDKGN